MKALRSGHLFIVLISVLLSLLYLPPVDDIHYDQDVFEYAGMLIAKGGVPYVDLFDHKPPLIYFVDLAGYWLGPWGAWFIDALLVAVATIFFYDRCREKKLPLPWLLPLFFNLLIRNYMVLGGYASTRGFTAMFLIIAFCILLKRPRYSFFWLGLLTSATFLMQQEQLLTLAPFLVYAIADNLSTARQFLIRLAQAAAGASVIAVPILGFFFVHHALDALWRDAFLFNLTWYADKPPLGDHFRAIHSSLTYTELNIALLICITLAITALLLPGKPKKLTVVALLATAFSFAPELISGRMVAKNHVFDYYLTPLAATLPVLLFTAWAATEHPFLRSKVSHAVFGFLVCASPLYNALQHATHLRLDNDRIATATPQYQYLNRQPLADYQLYVFGNKLWPLLYDHFRILSPSPWIYHHFWHWYPRWDNDHKILMSIGHDLLAHRTRYVLDFSDPKYFVDHDAYTWWKTFLQLHYQPIRLPGASDQTLWELKPDAINIPPPAGPPAS